MESEDTPLMQQWRGLKARHPDALLFFRVGDFYEMFFEDAEEGARLLDLTLTSRNNGSSRAPLAGIPVHALEGYLQRLVRAGRRVAICEQVEDPAEARGIVRREVVETVTPGTALSDGLLESGRNNYLAAIGGAGQPGDTVAIAHADLSTGEFRVQRVRARDLATVLGQIEPSEIVVTEDLALAGVPGADDAVHTVRPAWIFEATGGAELLSRIFGVLGLEGFGFSASDGDLIGACGALATYVEQTQPAAARALRPPQIVREGGRMVLDEMTRRNLELVEPLGLRGGATLLSVLDRTATAMGARELRRWLLSPLLDADAIRARQAAVAELVEEEDTRRATRAALREIRDLERLAVKIGSGRAAPRDLLALAASLAALPRLESALANAESPLLEHLRSELDPLEELCLLIARAIDPDAPPALADGGVIRSGFRADLDEIRALRDGALEWIARLQAQERERTGIGSLKVGFNKVFGYYLEITRANLDRVPDDYQRKQTLANAERYVTPELKEWEQKVLGAEERILGLEREIFEGVRAEAAGETKRLQLVGERVAAIDVLCSLAETAVRRDYVRPEIHEAFRIELRGGRHPVVETMMPREQFIPNDIVLDEDSRVLVLTGPNMAGKSTVLRQTGLIVLLAQIGSFVPCRAARVGMVDRIFTRVGASDNLVRGQSTFMVEMHETAAILNEASARSLVLLDEIGRGTSTWDGLSVATAVTEYLHERIGAKTVFATHYHELTRLEAERPGIVNFSVAVKEEGDHIVFLRSLVRGGADRSYGVEVARLAGLPPAVIARARFLLSELEANAVPGEGRPRTPLAPDPQLGLFAPEPHPAVELLRTTNPDQLTPLQALNFLADLVAQARR